MRHFSQSRVQARDTKFGVYGYHLISGSCWASQTSVTAFKVVAARTCARALTCFISSCGVLQTRPLPSFCSWRPPCSWGMCRIPINKKEIRHFGSSYGGPTPAASSSKPFLKGVKLLFSFSGFSRITDFICCWGWD